MSGVVNEAFKFGFNGALNEVPERGRFCGKLACLQKGARRAGTKLRFSILFWHVLIRYPAKADHFNKVTKQFGLALHSGTFLLDAGVRSTGRQKFSFC